MLLHTFLRKRDCDNIVKRSAEWRFPAEAVDRRQPALAARDTIRQVAVSVDRRPESGLFGPDDHVRTLRVGDGPPDLLIVFGADVAGHLDRAERLDRPGL